MCLRSLTATSLSSKGAQTPSTVLFLRAPTDAILCHLSRQVWCEYPTSEKRQQNFSRAQEVGTRAGRPETEAKAHIRSLADPCHQPRSNNPPASWARPPPPTPVPATSSQTGRQAPVSPHTQTPGPPGVLPEEDPYRSLFRAILGGSRLGFSMDSICGHRRK